MGLNMRKTGDDDDASGDDHGTLMLMAPFALAVAMGLMIAVAALALLWRGPMRLEPLPLPPAAVVAGGDSPLVLGLLIAGLLVLLGIFFVLLLLLFCMCGCGKGGLGPLARLLALLLPGLVGGLRQASGALGHAAHIADGAVEPLHTLGTKLMDTGATLAVTRIPRVTAQTASFWSALRRALRDSPASIDIGQDPPDGFPNFLVLSSFSIDPNWTPMGGDDGIGSRVNLVGVNTYAAGDRASDLATDCRNASTGLATVADTIEAVQP